MQEFIFEIWWFISALVVVFTTMAVAAMILSLDMTPLDELRQLSRKYQGRRIAILRGLFIHVFKFSAVGFAIGFSLGVLVYLFQNLLINRQSPAFGQDFWSNEILAALTGSVTILFGFISALRAVTRLKQEAPEDILV